MWIVGTSAAAQRVRANLYGALLSYLRIGKAKKAKNGSDEERLRKANLEVLQCYGDAFLDIVCRDSVSDQKIVQLQALLREVYFIRELSNGSYLISKSPCSAWVSLAKSSSSRKVSLAALLVCDSWLS